MTDKKCIYFQYWQTTVKPAIVIASVIASIFAINACSNALEGTDPPPQNKVEVDTSAPVWSVTPDNTGLLSEAQAITVFYSESMDTASLNIAGGLSSESSAPLWTATNTPNDTLILTPNTQWSDGLRRSIRIEASDTSGNASSPVILSYVVDSTPPTVTAVPSYTISNTPLTITLTCNDGTGTGCAAVYYTINGIIPDPDDTTNALLYGGPVSIDTTTKFKYIGVDNAGNVSGYVSGWYTIDPTPPTAVVTPASNQIIGSHRDIQIQFSESMDVNTLDLSGTLAAEVGVVEWTTVSELNDHLTLHPVNGSQWSFAVDATLSIAAQDLAGNDLATDISLTYDIGMIHVSVDDVNAADDNPGTRALPFQSIQSAITKASLLQGPSEVLVAQGVYLASNLVFTEINLVEEVSIYGGYAPDWSTHDPLIYTTTITAGDLVVDPQFTWIEGAVSSVMVASSGVTWRTTVEGFVIDGGVGKNPTGRYSAVNIRGGADPMFWGNTINGGSVDGEVYGVYIDNASPILENNTIVGATGTSTASNNTYAIHAINGAYAKIKRNLIRGGTSATNAVGVSLLNASAYILNNDIDGGEAATVYGVLSDNSSMDFFNNVLANQNAQQDAFGVTVMNNTGSVNTNYYNIYNNIIDAGVNSVNASGVYLADIGYSEIKNNIITNGYCIHEAQGINPSAVENNDLFNCTVPYYDADGGCTGDLDGDGVANTCTVAELNLLVDITVGNNLSDDPVFFDVANRDYHFGPTSPISVIEGGLDLSGVFTEDKDDVLRTVPWSIGAYEKDAFTTGSL